MFNYSFNRAFKDIVSEFPLVPTLRNYESIYSNNLYYGQEIKLEEQTISSYILSKAFNTKTI